jgi:hypothetical protein
MRLNFAGVPEADIQEGIGRIGAAIRTQLGLLGSLTGSGGSRVGAPDAGGDPSHAGENAPSSDDVDGPLADVVALPRRAEDGAARRLRDR